MATIDDVAIDILICILKELELKDICNASLVCLILTWSHQNKVCKTWNRTAEDDLIWKNLFSSMSTPISQWFTSVRKIFCIVASKINSQRMEDFIQGMQVQSSQSNLRNLQRSPNIDNRQKIWEIRSIQFRWSLLVASLSLRFMLGIFPRDNHASNRRKSNWKRIHVKNEA